MGELKKISGITEDETLRILEKDTELHALEESGQIILATGKVEVRERQSCETQGVILLEIQCRNRRGISSQDQLQTVLLPVRKEDIVNLSASLLRQYQPSFEDRILSALQRIEDRIAQNEPPETD